MGLGCRHRGTAKGRNNKIIIASVKFKPFRDDHGRTSRWQNRKQEESLVTATDRYCKWTDEDYKKLWSLDHLSVSEAARIMKRSMWSIRHKRRKRFREAHG